MLPVKKLSPSSINTLDGCEMKWFLQYIIGYREPSGRAAVIGSTCHYILESVAKSKLVRQQNKKYINDKIMGRISGSYKLDKWVDKATDSFFEKESHIKWEDSDRREVRRNIEKAEKHKLFPENHSEIISPEDYFSIPLSHPWARYRYKTKDGEESGSININGIIDLIYRDENGTLSYLDYKFGQPKDWNTGKNKNYASIAKDVQLCMYYYAVKQRFPNEDIEMNIWYVNKELVFTDFFGQEQESLILAKLESVINKLRSMTNPETNYGFTCRFCPFSKTKFEQWGRPNLDVPHNKFGKRFPPIDSHACVCDAAKSFIDIRGLTATMENLK